MFAVWLAALAAHLPVLRLEMSLPAQLVAPLFFASNLLVIFAWSYSGLPMAAVIAALLGLTTVYAGLSAKDPGLFLQLAITALVFALLASYLKRIGRAINDKQIEKEKLQEDVHLTEEAIQKNHELEDALSHKIARLMDLQKFSEELKGIQEVHAAARKIVGEAHELIGRADRAALYLVDETRQQLRLVASHSTAGRTIREKGSTIFDEWVMKRNQAIMIEDSHNDFRFFTQGGIENDPMRSVCASPLVTENKVLGVLRLSSGLPGSFTADDLRLLDIFASLGAVALRNLLLYERMEHLAVRDSLTGLFVKRHFLERLGEEIRRSQYDHGAFSVALLDIDHFKRYNDEFGHAAGDLVLKGIASVITHCLGPSDLTARYGGEEFVMLLPNQSKDEALRLAEHVRASIEGTKYVLRHVEARVTASIGVAAFPGDGRGAEELLWAADKNLYAAKHAGRNRVCGNT